MENNNTSKKSDDTFDPGTARFGNFINYYSFNPADERIRLLPNFVQFLGCTTERPSSRIVCMDIGCNTGELTQALHTYITKSVGEKSECHILGVDMDEILILRANENNHSNFLTFKCASVMEENFKTIYRDYLEHQERHHFDVVFCFSVTMWIHLNHGDDGLKHFITSVSDTTNIIVVEAQPWRCYTRAVNRMKHSKVESFPMFDQLKIRQEVEDHIDNLLTKECNFTKVLQSSPTKWKRQINIYKRNQCQQ
ncbi:probable RNA methyltransferase CG11342 [Macrosteles quadrilineatus]|uniref:probable RNA methyltransferase CG11342 n=1 Tax=Macrosteles quadrilineatus TaxID=74068 RepID=UPI0023E1DD90|nr:probable RNA methyltransferase CG11342 [Macrosteles quadrilineatus]